MDGTDALRRLPRVDAVIAALGEGTSPWVGRAARAAIDHLRQRVLDGDTMPEDPQDVVVEAARARLDTWRRPAKRRVVNATGVVLHTNLGRAPWTDDAVAAASAAASAYTDLEVRLEVGQRGGRLTGVADRLARLTGAEAGIAVNNGAAAVLLALTALAHDRDVVVSRGELVEIGGSFRVPDVVAAGGARLVEVGTTNRTRRADVEEAVGPDTAVLLRVHRSNFRVEGFTASVPLSELVEVARARGLAVVVDEGSGSLDDVGDEPGVRRCVAEGADVVAFSGDKLLGGPQAGLLVGTRTAIGRLRSHPLYRALRLDKTLLAALDATLRAHEFGEQTRVDAMLVADPAWLEARASAWAEALRGRGVVCEVGRSVDRVGGGALAEVDVPGPVLFVDVAHPHRTADALRRGTPAVLVRVRDDRVEVHPRTVLEGEDDDLVARLAAVARGR